LEMRRYAVKSTRCQQKVAFASTECFLSNTHADHWASVASGGPHEQLTRVFHHAESDALYARRRRYQPARKKSTKGSTPNSPVRDSSRCSDARRDRRSSLSQAPFANSDSMPAINLGSAAEWGARCKPPHGNGEASTMRLRRSGHPQEARIRALSRGNLLKGCAG